MGLLNEIRDIIIDMPNQKKKPLNKTIMILVVALMLFGVIMIWSANMYNSSVGGDNFELKQLIFVGISVALIYFISLCNYKHIKYTAYLYSALMFMALIIILFLPEQQGVNGAVRWISIGSFSFQPSEFFKVAVLLIMARVMYQFQSKLQDFKFFIFLFVCIGIMFLLVQQQPALSAAIILFVLAVGMYFMGGGRVSFVAMAAVIGVVAVSFYIIINPWRLERIFSYIDPFKDLTDGGWQPAQSLMALGSGGFSGRGIGNGRAKFGFLPELENDYIFAVIAEELGFIGCVVLICVFLFLIFQIIKVAIACTDMYSRMICAGAAVLISVQVFLNMAVVSNLMPSTGVVLPFISYGGSSLITFSIVIGLVLNVSRNIK